MKKYLSKFNWFFLIIGFIFLSVCMYFIHYLIFKDYHHIFIYLIADIAFIPIDIIFVTLIFHKVLAKRDKKTLLKKLNMVIGAFFNEVGTDLLRLLLFFNEKNDLIEILNIEQKWDKKRFLSMINYIKDYNFKINYNSNKMNDLKKFLIGKREFLLRLLENSNLLEHESFTDLLWAVFHLTDELYHRKNIDKINILDTEHLVIDIKRVYNNLLKEWLYYLLHLKEDYPYLYSLEVRLNPFNKESKVEID